MSSPAEVLAHAARLVAEGRPHALATVVNVVRPASTRRGERAVVTAEGTLEGWVGGACSDHVVVREALAALRDGEARLVRICPPDAADDVPEGMVVAESSCASEGIVDVLIEPFVPAPLLAVLGDGPAARTLASLARTIGWRVTEAPADGADAVVVAGMGRGDEDELAAALETGAGYVGLVASGRRAATVLGALRDRGVSADALARVRSPAGLDLGPSTQEEIAVAILGELVQWRHTRPSGAVAGPEAAVDAGHCCGHEVPPVAT
jgi:xanthine dehydrogenase accessory factor